MTLLAIFTGGAMDMTDAAGATGSGPRWIFDLNKAESEIQWLTVNDGVMGGVSTGHLRRGEDGELVFHGSLSLENNGGFASVRSRGPVMDLSEFGGLAVRVRGDGRQYSLSVRTDYAMVAGAYYFDIQTEAGVWQEVYVPFAAFHARAYGRRASFAPDLNARAVESVGFILADKQAGDFQLEVAWIKATLEPREADATVGSEEKVTPLADPNG